jgi:hypothetical protein
MPVYYFDVRCGEADAPHWEGLALPDDDAARCQTILGARSILAAEAVSCLYWSEYRLRTAMDRRFSPCLLKAIERIA